MLVGLTPGLFVGLQFEPHRVENGERAGQAKA
jgi:hypothetical protein